MIVKLAHKELPHDANTEVARENIANQEATRYAGKSILCDQPTHVGRESVDYQPTNSQHFTVSWPKVGHL